MDPTTNHELQLQLASSDQDAGGGGGGCSNNKSSSFVCRQTSSRWTPTSEQIRILKELYYNNGVRSPSAEQIQKISARLRQYGKIEGKNVFYWFQNHKARERQKKRLTTTADQIPMHHQPPPPPPFLYTKCPPPNFAAPGAPSSSVPSPAGMIPAVSQFGKYGYGSLAMEKSFKDSCSISQGVQPMIQNFVWAAGVDPYTTFLEKKKYSYNYYDESTLDDHDQDQDQDPEIETLPLFPMHGDINDDGVSGNFSNMKQDHHASNYNYGNIWYQQPADDGNIGGYCSRASLELTLNSYGCMSPFSP